MSACIGEWQKITSDKVILEAVTAYKLELLSEPCQSSVAPCIPFSVEEQVNIDMEIKKLLDKGAIRLCTHTQGEFISNIFTRPKRSGGFRIILNLKQLNKYVKYEHFKMEHIDQVTDLIYPNDVMTSIDLKDAYFSISLHESC